MIIKATHHHHDVEHSSYGVKRIIPFGSDVYEIVTEEYIERLRVVELGPCTISFKYKKLYRTKGRAKLVADSYEYDQELVDYFLGTVRAFKEKRALEKALKAAPPIPKAKARL